METPKSYKSYSTFSDVEDRSIRIKNQGVTIANIIEDNMVRGKVTRRGLYFAKEYLGFIVLNDKEAVINECEKELKHRGYEWE